MMKGLALFVTVLCFAFLAVADEETPCATTSDCLALENACTFAKCIQGVCRFKAISCADDDDCTIDNCDPVEGCKNERIPNCVPELPTVAEGEKKDKKYCWSYSVPKEGGEEGEEVIVNYCKENLPFDPLAGGAEDFCTEESSSSNKKNNTEGGVWWFNNNLNINNNNNCKIVIVLKN
eukprot:TRINITY_DN4061_c0_g1_i4.p1 TRINITY_DN4061_c0_g1~~TRINITY_DN4061_c0_g1_i4.p1  ORF type:complete len:178 (+),score=59.30 TRINITY_DN4061_c0_g1_i4:358-891(+)